MTRSRRSEETRRKLLDRGLSVLLERGYHGTGLREVLESAGVPKGSFYNHFRSKEDFCAQVIRHFAEDLNEKLDAALRNAGRDALASLRKFLRDLGRSHEAKGFVGGCLVGNLGAEIEDSDLCREAMVEALRGWRDRVQQLLALAQRQGRVRTDRTARSLAAFLLDAWEGAVIRMKIERPARPLEQCMRHMLDGYLRP